MEKKIKTYFNDRWAFMKETLALAVDTTSMDGSVALLARGALAAERRWRAVESHSNLLLTEIQGCLAEAEFRLEDISVLVPVVGPGSFTGIRIGLGTVQGLASALECPILGVSALEALAYAVGERQHDVTSVIDARRGQVYIQSFKVSMAGVEPRHAPRCEVAEAWLRDLQPQPSYFVGNGALLYRVQMERLSAAFRVHETPIWLAEPAARLAVARLALGQPLVQTDADALYVRPPDVRLPTVR